MKETPKARTTAVVGIVSFLLAGCAGEEPATTAAAALPTTSVTVQSTTTTESPVPPTTEPVTTTTTQPTTTTTEPPTTTTMSHPPTTTTTEPPTTTTTEPPTTTTTEPPPPEEPLPNIVRFLSSPSEVAPSEEATIQWEVTGAVTVEMLSPGADNAAVESAGDLVVVQAAEGTYSYTLRAVNADGQVVEQSLVLAVSEPKGLWEFDAWSDELTGDQFQVLFLEATRHDYPDDEFDLYDEPPYLVIRCDEGAWVVFTTWGGQYVAASYDEGIPVAYRIDDGEVLSSTEWEMVSNEGVWVDKAEQFVSSLLGGETLVYRVWNFDDAEVGTATFPIAHLQNRIDELTNCSL